MAEKILFLDRDGTLIEEPEDFQVDAVEKVRLVAGVIPALLEIARYGFRFVMVSNQDGLGTDAHPMEQFQAPHDKMLGLFASQGITFAAVHDSFWTHAGDVPEMSKHIREKFIELHSEPLLEQLYEELKQKYPEIAMELPPPASLMIDARCVR